MLDSDTKSRIDSARDILVGKVPDPKSQVEQITIALIYKFMDDMDRQSEELGGKATFFSKDFKNYSWPNLLDPRLGGHERLLLYADGIEKMNQNKNIPQLFRDIFKGAFLPYRDPETLNLFLKEINGFVYDHSERLGDAFEYLLSVLGSQGEAGQFRTPRHIIDFIVKIVDPKKNETVLDPACGTAGFLISSFKHIMAANTKDRPGDQLSADERGRLMTNFNGYDISPDMVRLSRVNMYLHGFAQPRIYEYDTLTSEERWGESFDVILANPPFMSPKGGIRPHNRFSIKANRSEVLFVDYIAEHLNTGGRAGIIVPEGIIFQSQNAYKALRKMLIENYLWAVVSLPGGCFNPYSGVKTSILFLDKSLAKRTDEILFVKIEGDGFGLGAQRRANGKDDLPEALAVIQNFCASCASLRLEENGRKKAQEAQDGKIALIVSRQRILESADINLSGDRYRDNGIRASGKWPIVKLGEVAKVSAGNSAPQDKKYFAGGTVPFFRTSDVGSVHVSADLRVSRDKLTELAIKDLRLTIWPEKTILFPKSGASTFLNHRVMLGCPGVVSSHLSTILADETHVNALFLFHLLCYIDARSLTEDQNYPSLRLGDLERIEIPLPPLEEQERIVAELDGYQNVIEGAKQVITNYRPTIKIDSQWPRVKLGDVFKLSSGEFLPEKARKEGPYKVYGGNGVTGSHNVFTVESPALVIGRVGAYCGVIHITEPKVWISDNALYVVDFIQECDQSFIATMLRELNLNQYAKVGGQPSISQTTIYELEIPLPPLDVQREIVAELETERALVESSRKLVEIFEKKIRSKLVEIWGEIEVASERV